MKNNDTKPHAILPTDKIAQLIFEVVVPACTELATELPTTSRGAKGFGSTNNTSKQRYTHSTFCLDKKYVLVIINKNPFCTVAQRLCALMCKQVTHPINLPIKVNVLSLEASDTYYY